MRHIMLFFAALTICMCSAHAQTVERLFAKDTITNVDTARISFNAIRSGLKSIQISATKVSGTVAGSAYVQGTVDGNNWVSVTDTLTLGNVATSSTAWTFDATYYNSYRVVFIGSGTMKAAVSAALLRRSDD